MAFRAQYVPNLTPRCELRSAERIEPEGNGPGQTPLFTEQAGCLGPGDVVHWLCKNLKMTVALTPLVRATSGSCAREELILK